MANKYTNCNCGTFGSAHLCPTHTQADYDAAEAARITESGHGLLLVERVADAISETMQRGWCPPVQLALAALNAATEAKGHGGHLLTQDEAHQIREDEVQDLWSIAIGKGDHDPRCMGECGACGGMGGIPDSGREGYDETAVMCLTCGGLKECQGCSIGYKLRMREALTNASVAYSRQRLSSVFRDWIHEQPFSECNAGVDTCPDWKMAYELADLVIAMDTSRHETGT